MTELSSKTAAIEYFLRSTAPQPDSWLQDNGMQALELLSRAVSFNLSVQSSPAGHEYLIPIRAEAAPPDHPAFHLTERFACLRRAAALPSGWPARNFFTLAAAVKS
jgi:hypothetical protein